MDGPRRRCAGGSGCRRVWQCGSPTARLDGMDWMEFGWHVARWQGWMPGDGGKWRVQCGYGATILKGAARTSVDAAVVEAHVEREEMVWCKRAVKLLQ